MKTFATICSGIGAPEVAATRLGWKCLFSSEIEPFPNAVRARHFPDDPNYGDMTKYHDWPKSNPDVLVAGTPCQAFSIAGLRKGMADPRGNLTLTFLGIIERYAPRWVLWENVPGVHSSWSDAAACPASDETASVGTMARNLAADLGFDGEAARCFGEFEEVDQTNDFDGFLSALEELGYGVATAVYDAQYFGLAQRRERVFVVAHIGGQWQRAAAVLFERQSLCGHPPPRRETGQAVAPTISARTKGGGGLGTDAECDGGVIPIQEIGKRQSGTPMNGVGHGECGDPMFTLQQSAVHGVCAPIAIDSENNASIDLAGTLGHFSPSSGGHPAAVAIGIDGGETGFALRANASHSGDKGDGGVNTTLVAELSLSLRAKSQSAHDPSLETYIAHTLKAEGFDAIEDGTGRGTPLVAEIAPTLRAGGNKTGGDRPPGTDVDTAETLIPEVCSAVTAKWSKSSGGPSGDECQNLTICFSGKDHGADATEELSPTLRSGGHNQSHQNGGIGPAIAFPSRMSATQRAKSEDISCALASTNPTAVAGPAMAVRRLTPRECERLQGFPDDYTLITIRNKPAADGPRYKALGNSMAVPVIEWLLRRMDLVDEVVPTPKP